MHRPKLTLMLTIERVLKLYTTLKDYFSLKGKCSKINELFLNDSIAIIFHDGCNITQGNKMCTVNNLILKLKERISLYFNAELLHKLSQLFGKVIEAHSKR